MAKKDVSSIVSGAGWIGSLAHGVIGALRQRGVTDKQIHSLVVGGGELPVDKIADVLLGEIRKLESPSIGKHFMTVKLGQYSTTDFLREAILASGMKISDYANEILKKIPLSMSCEEVDLLEITVSELGFTKAVSRREIYERASALGLEVCPAEAIALARIQCNDGKWRIGGMEPMTDSDGGLRVLRLVGVGGALWLGTRYDHPDDLWDPAHAWVFVCPRRK